jgi:hypothetical protein
MSEFSVNLPPRLPAANAAANVMTAVVPDPPRHLTQLDNGTILKGVVQGRDNDGLLVVATDRGNIKLATQANLPPGSQVTLEVRATGDRLQVLVLSADPATSGPSTGQTPPRGTGAGASAPPPASGGGATPPPTRPAPPPVPVAIAGSLLQGTIVQAPPETLTQLFRSLLPAPTPNIPGNVGGLPMNQVAPQVAGQAVAQAAAQLAGALVTPTPGPTPVIVTQAQAPVPPGATVPTPEGEAQPLPAQPSSAPQTQSPAQAQPQAPAPQSALPKTLASTLQAEVQAKIETLFYGTAAPNAGKPQQMQLPQNMENALKLMSALPTGSDVKLRLIGIAPGPGQPVVIPAPTPNAPHVMAGRIVGYTPTGHAVLHSPLGAIVLQGNLAVPVGTELSFAVEPMVPPAAAALMSAPLPQFLLSLSRGWPSLFEALAILRLGAPGGTPGATPQPELDHLPQPGPKLAAGMMAAIQALRSGNIEALLGSLGNLRGGTPEREEAVRKLRQEFGQISSQAQDKPGVDWRCCFIPLLDDGTVRQINLFYRRDKGKDRKDEDAAKSGTRIIVEVDMSKMGPFQFDGLVREKRFDLMVRSHVALTPKMREDIGALFQEALTLGDYAGNLQFQKVKEFPVSPLEEIEKSATRVSA